MARVVLMTARLRLREFVPDDIDFVVAMTSHPEVMRYYPHPFSRPEAEWWLRRQFERYETDGYALWVVERLSDGERVGQIGVLTQEIEGETHNEVGYLLHRPFWHQGYATEAAAACVRYVFNTLGSDHVVSLIRPENAPSQAVATRNGLALRKQVKYHGYTHDLWWKDRPARARSAADTEEFGDACAGLHRGDFDARVAHFRPRGSAPPDIIRWYDAGHFAHDPEALAEALTCASFLGAADVARHLLDAGVDPTKGEGTGMDALHWAVNRGQVETTSLLLARGAPLERFNAHGTTVLGTAIWSVLNENRASHLQIIEMLLQAGADASAIGSIAEYAEGSANEGTRAILDAVALRLANAR